MSVFHGNLMPLRGAALLGGGLLRGLGLLRGAALLGGGLLGSLGLLRSAALLGGGLLGSLGLLGGTALFLTATNKVDSILSGENVFEDSLCLFHY